MSLRLLLLLLVSEALAPVPFLAYKLPRRRETNPPYPFDDGETQTTTQQSDPDRWLSEEDPTAPTAPSLQSFPRSNLPISNEFLRRGRNQTAPGRTKTSLSSEITGFEEVLPTSYYDSSSGSSEGELSGEGQGVGSQATTFTSIIPGAGAGPTAPSKLSPTSSSTTPFSHILANKTRTKSVFTTRVNSETLKNLRSTTGASASASVEESSTSVSATGGKNQNGETDNDLQVQGSAVPYPSVSPPTHIGPNSLNSLRSTRPTSSVIQSYNPSSYNRVVKRRKITSISGRQIGRNSSVSVSTGGLEDVGTTIQPGPEQDSEEEVTTNSPVATSHSQSQSHNHNQNQSHLSHIHAGNSNSSSRAIAGFSHGPKVLPNLKSRPKPIIIRDHDAYLRNLSTTTSTFATPRETESDLGLDLTTTVMMPQESESEEPESSSSSEAETEPPLSPPPTSTPHPLKVRKVKVSMRRPGPGLVGQVTSDLPIQSVTPSSHDVTPEVAAAVDYRHVRPSPSSPLRNQNQNQNQGGFTSRRVFKEEFGIQRHSYGGGGDPGHADEEEGEDMEVDSTTEHYSLIPPSGPPTGPGGSFPLQPQLQQRNVGVGPQVESSMHDTSAPDPSPTPKYRDYFAEINASGGPTGSSGTSGTSGTGSGTGTGIGSSGSDNLNHLYVNRDHNHQEHEQVSVSPTPVASVTVTVTKTVVNNQNQNQVRVQPTLSYNNSGSGGSSNSSESESQSQSQSQENLHLVATPSLPQGVTEKSNLANTPPVTNSVEEVVVPGHGHGHHSHNSSHEEVTPTPTVSSKATTSVYYTKVELPNFTSSSYEFTTSREYSESYGSPEPDHEHDEHDHEHEHDHEEGHDHHNETGHEHNHNHTNHAESPGVNFNLTTASTSNTNTKSSHNHTGHNHHHNHSSEEHGHDHDHDHAETGHSTFTSPSTTTSTTSGTGSSLVPVIVTKPYAYSTTPKNPSSNFKVTFISTSASASPSTSTPPFSSSSSPSSSSSTRRNEIWHSDREENRKGGKVPHFPAMYQVPVLVKMVLEFPQTMFCSHLPNFKQMIVTVYGHRHTGIDAEQVMIYMERNCSSILTSTSFDFVPTEPSLPQKPSISTSTTTVGITSSKPTIPGSGAHKTTEDTGGKSRRRRRQAESDVEGPKGGASQSQAESLILDSKVKAASLESPPPSPFKESTSSSAPSSTEKSETDTLVYFFVSDKQGKYDLELTMAFFAFWNETSAGENGTLLQGLFHQKIKKVDMVSASHLVSGEPETGNENSGIIAAIAIASIAALCLFLIGVLLLVLRHRQAQTKFAKRCTPVTLDDFSLDNISFSNSFRRKQRLRGSKRSYTNAAFDDHSAPTRVVTCATLHGALTDGSGLENEFKAIPSVSPTLDDIPQGAETKNRYANVIPMPDTRVLLTFQEEQPNSDYINANYVRGANGDPKRYIITQGPLDETTVDFWRMIWEQQIRVIFMLTDFAEAGIPKCADYYPRSETIDCSQLHGDFQVTLEKRDIAENCITSYLVIKDMERNLRRDVVHLWYQSWPERGVPTIGKPTVDFLLKSRKFTKESTPILVHCSPGTGRSGTVVACDIAMRELESKGKTDIPRILLRIRQDRAGSVQTKEQYLHIYESLHFYATRFLDQKITESLPT